MSDKAENLDELATRIVERFTPVAFLCGCQGDHPECVEVKTTDTWAIAQADTAYRISEFIRKLA
jgi:hypothetical protein